MEGLWLWDIAWRPLLSDYLPREFNLFTTGFPITCSQKASFLVPQWKMLGKHCPFSPLLGVTYRSV